LAVREITIDTDSLWKDIRRLWLAFYELKQKKEQMVQKIEELNKMWKGPANQMFVKQFQADCNVFDNFCSILEEMIQAMEHAKGEYEKCDDRINGIVTAIRI